MSGAGGGAALVERLGLAAELGGARLTSRRRTGGALCPVCSTVVLNEGGGLAVGIAAFALGPQKDRGCKHVYHHHCLANSVHRGAGQFYCVAQRPNRSEGIGGGALKQCGRRITGWTQQSRLPNLQHGQEHWTFPAGEGEPGASQTLKLKFRKLVTEDVFLGGEEGARGEEFFHPKVVRDWFEQDQPARAASCVVSVLRAGVPGGGTAGKPVLQSVRLSREPSGVVGEVRKRGEAALDTLALSLREMVVEP